jgi:hypothetical protein
MLKVIAAAAIATLMLTGCNTVKGHVVTGTAADTQTKK